MKTVILILILLLTLWAPLTNAAVSPSSNIFPHYSLNPKENMPAQKKQRFLPLLESDQPSQDQNAEEKLEKKLGNETLLIQENELKKRQRGDREPIDATSNPIMLHFFSN